MPSVFPGALDNIPSNKLNSTVSATDHPDHHNLLADAVNAIEATLGAGLSNVVTSVGATAPITSTGGSAPTIGVTSAALTKTDDTNVTLTLGGSPTTALLAATSLTLGWTGTLSPARGGTGVNNGTNTLTIGTYGGTLAFNLPALTLTVTGSGSVEGTNTGNVSLAANSGLEFAGLGAQQWLRLGTPTTVTSSSTNAVSGISHSHAITAGLGFIGNGTAQNQIPVTGATPFAPAWTSISSISGQIDHNSTTNLTVGDVHTQYALLAGRSGGQTLIGGTAASNNLILQSTSNATRGSILFGTSAYDEVNNRLGVRNNLPQYTLDVGNASATNQTIRVLAASGNDSELKLMEASDNFGFTLRYDGGTDLLDVIRHDNNATGVSALTIGRTTGNVTLASKIIIPSGTVSAPSFTWAGDTNTGFFTETDGAFSFTSNGVQKIVFGPSSLQVNFSTLVDGFVRAYGAYNESTSDYGVYLGASSSTNARILFCNGTSGQNWQIDNDSSGNFRWYVPGYNMMRLTRLGVLGTSRPQVDFYYNNTAFFTIDDGGITLGNRADQSIEWVATAAGTAGRNYTIKAGSTTAGGTNTPGGTLYLDAGLGTGAGASNIIFRTGNEAAATSLQGLAEEMRLTSAGFLGIGTSNPTSQLHVVGTRSATSGDYIGTLFDFTQSAAGTLTIFAYRAIAKATHTSGVLAGLQSNSTQASFSGNGGTTSNGEILTSNAEVLTGHTVTNLNMIKVFTPTKTGTITNLTGLRISNMTGGSSTNYSIYTEGGAQYFTGPTTQVGDLTLSSADIITDTTTGTKIGTATTQKIGFFNATPIVRPTAYTQTYSTANKTMAARTAAALTNNTGGTVSTTLAAITAGATYTQADMVAVKNALASIADQINKLRTDSLDTTDVVNAIIDDLQALGLVG